MTISLTDIARNLNMAPSTISRALTAPDMVASATRERILKYIEEVGYVPNQQARNLRNKRTNTIGIVVNDLADEIIAKAANVMQDEASKRGYFPVLLSCEDSRSKEKQLIDSLMMSKACGLVIIPSSASLEHIKKLDIPIVELDRSTDSNLNDEFRMDDKAAMQMATSYLINEGCKHIGVLVGNVNRISSLKMRYLALQQCDTHAKYSCFCMKAVKADDLKNSARKITQHILNYQLSINIPLSLDNLSQGKKSKKSTDFNFSTCFDNLSEIILDEYSNLEHFKAHEPIDGLIAANNSIAAGMIQGFYASKQVINEKIKVFTFDNPSWLSILPYKIATITHPLDKAAALAINRLIDRVEGKYDDMAEVRLIRPSLLAE